MAAEVHALEVGLIKIILDLIANLALLVALSNLSGFVRKRWEHGWPGAILQGLLFGATAIFGMLRPLSLGPGLIFDGRSVVISLCGLFFGPLAAVIAGSLAAACRYLQGGMGAPVGMLVIGASVLTGLLFRSWHARRHMDPSVWGYFSLGLVTHVAMLLLMLALPGGAGLPVLQRIGLPVMLTYPLVTVLIGRILAGHMEAIRTVISLRENEERYRSILNASPDAIVITDLDGQLRMASRAALRMVGAERLEDLKHRRFAEYLVPEDRERVEAQLARVDRGTVPGLGEFRGLRADGSAFSVEANGEFILGADGQPAQIVYVVRDISERKRAEAALWELQEAWAQFVRHSPIYVYIKEVSPTTSRVLQVSDNFVDMVGIRGEDMVGRTMEELFPPAFAAKMTADDWAVVSRGETLKLDEELNGRSYTSIKFPIRAGDRALLAGYTIDITDLRQAERAIAEKELRLHTLVNSIPDLVWLKDADGVYLLCNPMFERFFGAKEAEIVGKTDYDFVDRAQADLFRENDLRAMALGRPVQNEESIVFADDGRQARLETTKTPMYSLDGRLIGVLGISHDITERKRMEEERRQLESQLQQAQKMESLGSLAGGVAHDMNNVLGAIMGLASVRLKAHPPESPEHRAYDTILKASERGGKMVRSLLNFARKSLAEERELNLNDLLRDEAGLLERTTLAKISLQLDLDPELPAVLGDPSALVHAIMNLCVNAADAMPGSGTLVLRSRRRANGWAEIQVQDSGEGMSPEVLEKAADPFFTTKPQGKGSGLGLALVYSTVKAHRGEIEIHSEPGRGTLVTLRFPPAPAGEHATQPVDPEPRDQARNTLMVLLVDDDELVRDSCTAMLERLGHGVSTAATGEEALQRLAGDLRPDVVILDLNMPGLGGTGTLPRLRALHPTLPVLLATGRADEAAMALARAHGSTALLPKPFSLLDIQRHLEALPSRGPA